MSSVMYHNDDEHAQLFLPSQALVTAKKSAWDVVRDVILYVGVATVVVGTLLISIMGVNLVKSSIGSRASASVMKSSRLFNSYASRTSPVAMSSYLSEKGFLPVFMEKYGFAIDKISSVAAEAVAKMQMGVKGEPGYPSLGPLPCLSLPLDLSLTYTHLPLITQKQPSST